MTEQDPNASRSLGKYQIVAEVGKGGFAAVYRARDLDLGRDVALKVLDPLLSRDPVWVARFRREAQAVASLEHPRIVPVYEIGQAEGVLFIASRLVEGGSLAKYLLLHGSLPWDDVTRIANELGEALDYAHGQGVLHRDLKPANVLLDEHIGAMLTDFGFARMIADNTLSVSLGTGLVGTPAYIAPEIWEGKQPTRRTDIYSMGCTVFEMATGRALFTGDSPPAVMMAHFQTRAFPKEWPEGIPLGLTEILSTALMRDPATRYESGTVLASALSALSKDPPTAPYDERLLQASSWRNAALKALEDGDSASASLAMQQWERIVPEDPQLPAFQTRLEATNKSILLTERFSAEVNEHSAETTDALSAIETTHLEVTKWWTNILRVIDPSNITSLVEVARWSKAPEISAPAWSPDGQFVVFGGPEGLYFYDLRSQDTFKLLRTLTSIGRHEGTSWVERVLFDKDGTIIGGDRNGQLWIAKADRISTDGRSIKPSSRKYSFRTRKYLLKPHLVAITGLALSSDGKQLASSSMDGTIAMAYYPHVLGDEGARFQLLNESVEKQRNVPRVATTCLAFSPDGQCIVSGSVDNRIRLWINSESHGRAKREIKELGDLFVGIIRQGHSAAITSLDFDKRSGQLLATSSIDGTIRLWDMTVQRLARRLDMKSVGVNDVAFSPDAQILVSGSQDGLVKVWEPYTGQLLATLHGHNRAVRAVKFRPDGYVLLSESEDGMVCLWGVPVTE